MAVPNVHCNESFTLTRNAAGRLVLTEQNGRVHEGVEPVRAFPLSDIDRLVSILDSHGHEITCVNDLAELPDETAVIIRQELTDREFLPRIEQILHVKTRKEPHEWDVITDRGRVQFLLRDDDIRRLGPTKAILVDAHGVRFYIPDSGQMDAKSRRILSQYLG
jgi:hypothetical protein